MMKVIASGLRGAFIAVILVLGYAAGAEPAPACPPGPPEGSLELPHLRSAIAHHVQGLVVALGSSSTQGAMASDAAHSYPAVLQQALSVARPEAHVAVINRGVGGQDAAEELARLEADVLAIRPHLVIWQVGANGALRNADPNGFRAMVADGVRRIQAAGADVVLMDNQQAPALLAKAGGAALDNALALVAKETGAGLFSRRELMLAWNRSGESLGDFLASDGLHHNDRGYFCVARSLARAVVAGISPGRPVTASR